MSDLVVLGLGLVGCLDLSFVLYFAFWFEFVVTILWLVVAVWVLDYVRFVGYCYCVVYLLRSDSGAS